MISLAEQPCHMSSYDGKYQFSGSLLIQSDDPVWCDEMCLPITLSEFVDWKTKQTTKSAHVNEWFSQIQTKTKAVETQWISFMNSKQGKHTIYGNEFAELIRWWRCIEVESRMGVKAFLCKKSERSVGGIPGNRNYGKMLVVERSSGVSLRRVLWWINRYT